MDPAVQLGDRLRPVLQGWAGRLRAEFPDVAAHVSDLGSGGLALECLLPDVAPGSPAQVALHVSLRDSDGTLTIGPADVVWGGPGGPVEAEIEPPRGELSPDLIEQVADRLPALFAALRGAIRRGRPPA
jgi:hypothetical protein